MPAARPGLRSVLSTASRYGSLQRVFNDHLREWHWQRNEGTFYQVWQPPGVVFSQLKRDHHEHGRSIPSWDDWGFADLSGSLRVVLGALSGRWVMSQTRQQQSQQWVVADSDDARMFHMFHRAMNAFGLDPDEPESNFPNVRLLHTNERLALKFFKLGTVRSAHVHFPAPERLTKPRRAALVCPKFLSALSDALEAQGEIHLVSDEQHLVEEACGTLTRSKLFTPCLAFPFHVAGVPETYPSRDLLGADLAAAKDGDAPEQLFYTRWEKRPPQLPNQRFQGGRGYADVVQGIVPPSN